MMARQDDCLFGRTVHGGFLSPWEGESRSVGDARREDRNLVVFTNDDDAEQKKNRNDPVVSERRTHEDQSKSSKCPRRDNSSVPGN